MIKIPCQTIVRMMRVVEGATDPIFQTLRLDHGQIVASDRKFIVVENLSPFTGVYHITVDAALLAQCETETQFSSVLDVIPNPALGFTMAKTTMGYTTGNIGVFPGKSEFDRWREVIAPCAEPAAMAVGGMLWEAAAIARLAAASPSGHVIFEELIDTQNRPTIMRDINDHEWCGFFWPTVSDGRYHSPATLPGWLK